MKRIILTLIGFIPLFCFSTQLEIDNPIPYNEGSEEYAYTNIVALSNLTQSNILKNSYDWAINEYGPSQYLHNYENTIFQKGSFTINPIMRVSGSDMANCYDIKFDIRIKTKDGSYKYEFCNIKIVSLNEKCFGFESSIEAFVKNAENCPKIDRKKHITFANDIFKMIDKKFHTIIKSMNSEISNPTLNIW